MEALQDAVEKSALLVTILDPFTFESEWVVKENEWARDKGVPIIALYDGDRYQWDQARWLHRRVCVQNRGSDCISTRRNCILNYY